MSEHYIRIKSIQEYRGGFHVEMLGEDVQMDLDFVREKSISFTCECGKKFYKRETAEEHLIEEMNNE